MHQKHWTTAELAVLKKYYPIGGAEAVQEHLPDRTLNSIRGCASRTAGVVVPRCKPWTTSEEKIIRAQMPVGGAAAVQRHLPRRTKNAIRIRAAKLNIKGVGPRTWLPLEVELLKKYYQKEGTAGLAKRIPRKSPDMIRRKACALGILRRYRNWTDEELMTLRRLYPKLGGKCGAALPGRTAQAIRRRAALLGLKVETRRAVEDHQERMRARRADSDE